MTQNIRRSGERTGVSVAGYVAMVIVVLLVIATPLVVAPLTAMGTYPELALVAVLLAIACGLAYYYGVPPRAGPR